MTKKFGLYVEIGTEEEGYRFKVAEGDTKNDSVSIVFKLKEGNEADSTIAFIGPDGIVIKLIAKYEDDDISTDKG